MINGGASDDGFEYFRGWLVIQGREVFEGALADPDSLAAVPAVREAASTGQDLDGEPILSIAWKAYRRKTGEEPPPDNATCSYPPVRFDWDFDDQAETERHLPRLSQLFHGQTGGRVAECSVDDEFFQAWLGHPTFHLLKERQ